MCVCMCVFVCVCLSVSVCVFISSTVVPGTPSGASFFEFELTPTRKDSADPTQHEFQHIL